MSLPRRGNTDIPLFFKSEKLPKISDLKGGRSSLLVRSSRRSGRAGSALRDSSGCLRQEPEPEALACCLPPKPPFRHHVLGQPLPSTHRASTSHPVLAQESPDQPSEENKARRIPQPLIGTTATRIEKIMVISPSLFL